MIRFNVGVIDTGAEFRDFLDGFSEEDALTTAVDDGGLYGASTKIKGESREGRKNC